MRVKSPKVYSLAQVEKLLRKGHSTVYGYINAGMIKVLPNRVKGRSGRVGMVVSEAEYERLKRNGVDSTGIKSALAKLGGARKAAKKKVGRGASAVAAKKRTKRSVADAPAPAKKRSAYARGVTKKQVRRNAAAAAKPVVKKHAKRGATGKTAKKRKK